MIGQAAASVANFLTGLIPGKAGDASAAAVPAEAAFGAILSQAADATAAAPAAPGVAAVPAAPVAIVDGSAPATLRIETPKITADAAVSRPAIALALASGLRAAVSITDEKIESDPAPETPTPPTAVHAALATLSAAFQRKPAPPRGKEDEAETTSPEEEKAGESGEGDAAPAPTAAPPAALVIALAPIPARPEAAATPVAGDVTPAARPIAIRSAAQAALPLAAPVGGQVAQAVPLAGTESMAAPSASPATPVASLSVAPEPVVAAPAPAAAAAPGIATPLPVPSVAGIAWTPSGGPAPAALAALVPGYAPATAAPPATPAPPAPAPATAAPIDIDAMFPLGPAAPFVVHFAGVQQTAADSPAPAAPADGVAIDASSLAPAAAIDAATPAPATFAPALPQTSATPAATISTAPLPDVQQAVLAQQLDLARDSAWLDQLARDISAAADKDGKLRFQLNPEHLGSLDIEVVRGQDGNSIRLSAETEAARQILADAQPRLIAEARAQGMKISETHVDLGGQGSTNGGGRGSQDGQPHPQNMPHRNLSLTMNGVRDSRADRMTAPRERYA